MGENPLKYEPYKTSWEALKLLLEVSHFFHNLAVCNTNYVPYIWPVGPLNFLLPLLQLEKTNINGAVSSPPHIFAIENTNYKAYKRPGGPLKLFLELSRLVHNFCVQNTKYRPYVRSGTPLNFLLQLLELVNNFCCMKNKLRTLYMFWGTP